jgi:hypothetical protein
MKLPEVLAQLLVAGNAQNSTAFALCFSEDARVHDEGKIHSGRKEIESWIADANERYHATNQFISYTEVGEDGIMEVNTAGDFPGSPLVLKYHVRINKDKIEYLKITG